MFTGEGWKDGIEMTAEDVVKFHATRARLLLETAYHAAPVEGVITTVENGGEYFVVGSGEKTIFGGGGFWARRTDVRLISMTDRPEPILKKKDLDHEMLKFMSAEISKMMIPEDAKIKLEPRPLHYSVQYVSQPSIWKRIAHKLGFCRG